MVRTDLFTPRQIGNGAGHPQQPVIAPPGKPHPFVGRRQQPVGLRGQHTVFFQQRGGQPGIAGHPGAGIPPPLDLPGRLHPPSHLRRGLRRPGVRHPVVLHRGHLHLQIHPVQQRAAYFVQVQAHLGLGAGARPGGMPKIAAGTGVHGPHQHKAAGIGRPAACPADGNDPILQRLPQRFHRRAGKLRQLIHKQHAVVRQ